MIKEGEEGNWGAVGIAQGRWGLRGGNNTEKRGESVFGRQVREGGWWATLSKRKSDSGGNKLWWRKA